MNTIAEGTRVRCRPVKKNWNYDAWQAVNGKTGVVTQVKPDRVTKLPQALVTFDTPAEFQNATRLPTTGFWFDASELIKL